MEHRNVPIGTLLDHEGQEREALRDYDAIKLPPQPIPLEELPALRKILDDYERDALACRAEMAAAEAERPACGHKHVIGDVEYACERQPHPVDGYGDDFRHAAEIDGELAEGTDEGDGFGPATLVTWGEDDAGDGQDWEVAWGCVAERDAAGDEAEASRG